MKYIVELETPEHATNLQRLGKVGKPQSLKNFVIVETEANIDAIRRIPGVKSVEPDTFVKAHQSLPINQPNPPGWGLPWISNTGGSYENQKSGAGVDIYVVDTGVRGTHQDLSGRVHTLWSFDDEPYSESGYEPSHGTSVAACAAGTEYGTAKLATIINLRIDFYLSSIIKACDLILKHHLEKPDNRQSVVNFSGGSISSTVGTIFSRLTQWGIVVVAAAGNESAPEPTFPARDIWVESVGALNQWNGPAWFTNKRCKVFGPGQDVTTASVFSDTASATVSGTSFSSPYYAGLLAALLTGSDKFNTAAQVSNFTFAVRQQLCDSERIPVFYNGGYVIRTMNCRGFGGTYYRNPSRDFTDLDIRNYCLAHVDNPQAIADGARDYNISLNRLATCLSPEYSATDINQYFLSVGVSPWWFVDGQPV